MNKTALTLVVLLLTTIILVVVFMWQRFGGQSQQLQGAVRTVPIEEPTGECYSICHQSCAELGPTCVAECQHLCQTNY